jgi:hypothetical protein
MKRLCVSIVFLFFLLNFSSVKALFFDFEDDAQLKEWESMSGTWKIEKDDLSKSKVASGEGASDVILAIGDEKWTDYTVEFEANGLTDDIGIVFRIQDINNHYGFLITPSFKFSEWFLKKGAAYDENLGPKDNNPLIKTNEWHKYKLVVAGMQARIFIDGKEPFDPVKIDKGFEKGKIGIRQWGDHGHYDNVLISGPGIPLSAGEKAVKPGDKLASAWGIIKIR